MQPLRHSSDKSSFPRKVTHFIFSDRDVPYNNLGSTLKLATAIVAKKTYSAICNPCGPIVAIKVPFQEK